MAPSAPSLFLHPPPFHLMLFRPQRRVGVWAWQARLHRLKSTWVHHEPSPTAPREVPTPLILLSANQWTREGKSEQTLAAFASHFTARGWSVSCLDLDPGGLPKKDSEETLSALESELKSQLSSHGNSPFPPLIVARNLATLIAETYVSSNSLSGLVLIDPPVSPEAASNEENSEGRLPTPLPPFTYEATFPCMVAWTQETSAKLPFWEAHRIEHLLEDEADGALDRKVVDLDAEEEASGAGPHEVRLWAEDNGMLQDSDPRSIDEDIYENDGDVLGAQEDTVRSKARVLPAWYTEGDYSQNPSKSKKEPLLLDTSHIVESFIRGSGPGGQAINKLSTCVQLKHTPTGIVIRCQDTRSRELNRELARRKLSKELEWIVFGDRDSVKGKEAWSERRKKGAKRRKRQRKGASEG